MKTVAIAITRVFGVFLGVALFAISALAAVPRFAYVVNSKDATLSTYSVDAVSGHLRNNGYVLTEAKPSGVTIAGGAFVYVSNSGKNNVSAFKLDAVTGALTPVTGSPFGAGAAPAAISSDPAGKFVFVANKGAGNVSAFTINATTGALTAVAGSPFPAGTSPAALAVDPTGKFLYVGNNGSNSVSAFSIGASGALTAVSGSPFPAGTAPAALSIAPSGKFVYVANSGSNNVSGYSVGANGALTPVPSSPFTAGTKPAGIALDPNSKFAYVANSKSNTVSAFTIAANGALTAVGTAVAAGKVPAAITVDASAKFVFVANTTSDDVSTYTIGGSGALTAVVPGPTRTRLAPSALALSSGSSAVVYAPAFAFGPIFSGASAMSVLSVNNTSGAMTAIPGGPFGTGSPQHLAVSPNGKFVYTANRDNSNTVGEFSINLATGVPTSVGTAPSGSSPLGVVVDPSGRFVYTSGINTNSVFAYKINPQTGVLTTVKGSPFAGVGSPSGLAVDPTGRYLMAAEACCANTAGIFVYVINPKTGALKAVAGSPFLPPANTAEPGAVTVDPTGRFVYVTNNGSFGNTGITAYTIAAANGKLQLTGGLLPGSNTSPAIVATDVVGKYVYMTETATTTSAFTIDNATGALTKMSGSPFVGTGLMQGVVAEASGRFLYISNGTNVIGYSINPSTGFITALPSSPYAVGATIFDLEVSSTIH